MNYLEEAKLLEQQISNFAGCPDRLLKFLETKIEYFFLSGQRDMMVTMMGDKIVKKLENEVNNEI
jgi:hypothetical protein